MSPYYNHIDGDHSTFVASRGFRKTLDEFYTMDPGAPLPLERFVIQLPPPEFTEHISTDQLQIVAADVMPEAIDELQIQPRTFTPNGHGHNNRALISYRLFGLLDATVEVTIFNLAGEAVRRFVVSGQQAGTHPPLVWDGRGDTGQLLVPGLYLWQAKTSTSRGRTAITTPTAIT